MDNNTLQINLNKTNIRIEELKASLETYTADNQFDYVAHIAEELSKLYVLKDKLERLNQEHDNNEYINDPSITSRLSYIQNETAIQLWNFLKQYNQTVKEDDGKLSVIPTFRVLDALSMIDSENIGYSES